MINIKKQNVSMEASRCCDEFSTKNPLESPETVVDAAALLSRNTFYHHKNKTLQDLASNCFVSCAQGKAILALPWALATKKSLLDSIFYNVAGTNACRH